ncbi:PREDICTED: cell cycle checkpoint protein RAD17 isoform X2 [Nelumbo nucifera]|uniref:Cell cycle checkpoint protein RAD17 isoform X2 n=1 Tax=Nelumbo nucifera TaxID=4432 RepID=A0A1U8Q8L0_NELNU|nr:PREDICTED: cell cycle checkpoint protein RAD17 isoform X2 [Nelumbo nucifera]
MGKGHVVIVSSSDDEDGARSRSAKWCSSKSKSLQSVSHRNSRSSKRARLSGSGSRLFTESRGGEEVSFDALYDDFHEGLQGFTVVSGAENRNTNKLWVDKYRPLSLSELSVHRKKVEVVKMWLEERLRYYTTDKVCNCVLLITGQAGIGKSATIHAIAAHLGARLCEWNTPTPTLWQEYMHNVNSGVRYMSKLDEFESFVERVRKYPLLPLSLTGASEKPVILLIDDLPLMNGRVAYKRLCNCLFVLARSTQIPTVILITEYAKVESGDNTTLDWEELQSSLESAGASKITFNPVTVNSIKKILSRICKEEQCNVTVEQIDQIARSSGGDIRHAITSLQYFCLRPGLMHSFPLSTLSTSHSKEKLEFGPLDDGFSLLRGRDETLSLFHALGKFLHNKREAVEGTGFGQDHFLLKEKLVRLPWKMDAPEKVLSQAHGKARLIADFLHENVLDFISDEAVEDAWAVASYLSDADCLLSTHLSGATSPQVITSKYELENIAQLAAASVAVRGVLFGNSHPSPSRWHSIRSPKLWQVEQSSKRNKTLFARNRFEACSSLNSYTMSVTATELTPALKWVGLKASEGQVTQEFFMSSKMEIDGSDWESSDDLDTEAMGEDDNDEIEEW